MRREIVDYHLAGLENIPAGGAEAVTFDDSVADGFGLADADEVFFTLGAGEVGTADVGAFVVHGGVRDGTENGRGRRHGFSLG